MKNNNNFKVSRIEVYAPGTSLNTRTRLAKLKSFACSNNLELNYYGWERIKGELKNTRSVEPNVREVALVSGGGYANKIVKLFYLLWMIRVFLHVLLFQKNKTLWCLGWETALPAYLASFFMKNNRIVFDDADRFSMLFKLPTFIKKAIQKSEQYLSYNCFLHIVPGFSRYSWKHDRMFLLRNAPLISTLNTVNLLKQVKPDKFTIYMNGWIAKDTGAPVVLEALNLLAKRNIDFELIIAGRIVSDSGRKLVEQAFTKYLGELKQKDALDVYLKSDVVITAYDPSIEVNIHAESNKWADCILLGTPFIVNSEIKSARFYVDSGVALSFPYNSSLQLAEILSNLSKNQECLADLKSKAISFQNRIETFEKSLSRLFKKF